MVMIAYASQRLTYKIDDFRSNSHIIRAAVGSRVIGFLSFVFQSSQALRNVDVSLYWRGLGTYGQ